MRKDLARYGQAFKDRAVARLLPPESAALEVVAREVGIGAGTLERWREDAQSRPARGRAWTAGARLEAVITTAAMNEAAKSAWCREHGVYPPSWTSGEPSATQALADPEDARASPAGHTRGPQAHQGTRTRSAAQGPGAGRDGSPAGAVKKSRGDLQQRARTNDRPRRSPALAQDIESRTIGRRAAASGLRGRRHRCAHAAALEGPAGLASGRWQAAGGAPTARAMP